MKSEGSDGGEEDRESNRRKVFYMGGPKDLGARAERAALAATPPSNPPSSANAAHPARHEIMSSIAETQARKEQGMTSKYELPQPENPSDRESKAARILQRT